jgi:hypothetical protein
MQCASCGNQVCDMTMGETCVSCPGDCGACIRQCEDGIDNDMDGKIDFRPGPGQGDPQCANPADNDESM